MADGFDAGSIFVSLKADLADFNTGIDTGKKALESFAQSGQKVSGSFDSTGASVATALDRINTRLPATSKFFNDLGGEAAKVRITFGETQKSTDQTEQTFSRANVTWARSANRILGVQLALITLSQHGGVFKDLFQGISNGVSTAAAAMQLFRGQVSLVGGGLIAVGVAGISFFTRYLEDNIKATDTLTEAEIKGQKVINAYTNALADANTIAKAFGTTLGHNLTRDLGLSESAFATNLKTLREIPGEISIIEQKISTLKDSSLRGTLLETLGGIGGFALSKGLNAADEKQIENLQHQIGVLNNEEVRLTAEQEKIKNSAPWAKVSADVVLMNEQLQKTREAFGAIQVIGQQSLLLGIAQPAEVASANLAAARKVLDEILSDNQKIDSLIALGKIPTDKIEEALAKKHSNTDIGLATSEVQKALRSKQAIDAVNDLASTFSTSVGDGLRDAIINGKKPMEALAAVGQNLFSNMVDQTVKRLETGLTEAFKAITGVAGEGIGLALTGILGAAGAILSKLGSKGSSSFNGVQSAVTSTQAVRGVVAGSANVAVADVGDNLSRAIQPLVDLASAANAILRQIESNTRGGGAGGFPAVSIPTA